MDKIKCSLASVAKQNGVSIDEVKREIQKAIDVGMANPDPKIKAWHEAVPLSLSLYSLDIFDKNGVFALLCVVFRVILWYYISNSEDL